MPLNEESSDSLSSWSRRSLNCVARSLRTSLPSMVSVPEPPSMVPEVALAPVTVRSLVDWFSMRSLPLSLDARTLSSRLALALISETSVSTVLAVTLVRDSAPPARPESLAPASVSATLETATEATSELQALSAVRTSSPPSVLAVMSTDSASNRALMASASSSAVTASTWATSNVTAEPPSSVRLKVSASEAVMATE